MVLKDLVEVADVFFNSLIHYVNCIIIIQTTAAKLHSPDLYWDSFNSPPSITKMKLGMFVTNDVLSGEIPGLRWNDQRSPGDRLFMMAAEIEIFLLFSWIGFDTICALDCVYLTDLLGFGSYMWIHSNQNKQHNIFSL